MSRTALRTVVVDDEALARERVRDLVTADPRLVLVGTAAHGREALDVLVATRPDLVFLDIRMPELDGFEVLAALDPDVDPRVVFVTAWDDHAVEAFEVGAVDYLLKPVATHRFDAAVTRAVAAAETRPRSVPARDAAARRSGESVTGRPFVVRRGSRHELVLPGRIDRIEADGNYIRLHVGLRTHLVRSTMKAAAARLDPETFVRIHRSHIVPVRRIRSVESDARGDYTVELDDGLRLSVGRRWVGAVRRLLGR